MRILALDLGTKTGWALWNGVCRTSGVWDLLPDKERKKLDKKSLRSKDPRPRRLMDKIKSANPDTIVVEDVLFASTQMQSQLYGCFRGVVMTFDPPTSVIPVPVGTLKKFATGKGNAEKYEMAAALNAHENDRWVCDGVGEKLRLKHFCPGSTDHGRLTTTDEVDALWLLKFHLSNADLH